MPAPAAPTGPALRLVLAALGLVLGVALFARAPAAGAALVCALVGLALALPAAADAAVSAGHRLARYAPGSPLRALLGGPVLRVVLCATVGIALALVLLVRLSAGGAGVWMTAACAAVAAGLAHWSGGPLARWLWAGVHAGAGVRCLAQVAGAAGALLGVLLAGRSGALPDPALVPATASALTAEIHAAHRLWAGAEAWMLGQAVALSLVPAWLAAALAVLGNAAVGWAVARLTVAALMPPAELSRGLAPASDAAVPPPPSRAGLAAAGAVMLATLFAALWAEARLSALPPEARPVARLQVAADRIGDDLFPPGTVDDLQARRDALALADADLAARLRAATEAGFDRVVANVDPFLDGYYSLWGEYARMIDLTRGQLEDRLTEELSAALAQGAPFATLDALRVEVAALRAAAQDTAAGVPLPPVNPGQVRLAAVLETLPPAPDLRVTGLTTTVQARAGLSLAAGAVAGLVAQRIVARLAARGAIGLAVRAIPLVGLGVAVGMDWASVELEERLNRDAFRAEIVAGIEAERARALALYD
jgi:hypothetical protein